MVLELQQGSYEMLKVTLYMMNKYIKFFFITLKNIRVDEIPPFCHKKVYKLSVYAKLMSVFLRCVEI